MTKRSPWAHRLVPLAAAALAVLLALPALWSGWRMDDYYHRAAFLQPPALRRPGLVLPEGTAAGLFRFSDGEPRHVRAAMEIGLVPWWTDPGLKAVFFRPLAALTHWLDDRLWPSSALPMHAQSLAWFGALALAAALLYQQFLGRSFTAGLAALLFAVDSAHGTPAGWLANRNSLLAAFFGVLAISAYDRWRRERWRPGMLATPLLLALSLLSAEAGLATAGYLLAHALFLDRLPWRFRLRALLPSLGVVLAWRALALAMGVGTRGMGLYADPGAAPLRFLAAVAERAPLLLLGQWTPIPAEIGFVLTAREYGRLWVLAVALLAALALCMRPLLRRDPLARFFAAGMLLSVVPMCAAFPDNRLLIFAGLGAMGLLAQFLTAYLTPGRAGEAAGPVSCSKGAHEGRPYRCSDGSVGSDGSDGLRARAPVGAPLVGALRTLPGRPTGPSGRGPVLLRSVAVVLAAIHLGIAPVVLPFQAAGWPKIYRPLYAAVPLDAPVARQSLIFVNGPLALLPCYLPLARAVEGLPVPRATRVLSPSLAAVRIARPDARTLILTPRRGYLARPIDTLFRDPSRPFRPGEPVQLSDMTITVTRTTPDGRPASIACRFRVPLEDRSLRWLWWQRGRYRAFRPPHVGAVLDLPPALPA